MNQISVEYEGPLGSPSTAVPTGDPEHDPAVLLTLFNELFAGPLSTRLEGGAEEPLYLPRQHQSNTEDWHRVIFTRDYFASALHEVAHWCIAGRARREQVDYGYWYAPDGRSPQQQRSFEQVEVKPQALEWIFARSARFRFRLSADNLNGTAGASTEFRQAVWQQARRYCRAGLPERPRQFAVALATRFAARGVFDPAEYRLEDI